MTRRTSSGRRTVPIFLGLLLVLGVDAAPSWEAAVGGLRTGSHSSKGHSKKGGVGHRSKRRHYSGGHYRAHHRGHSGWRHRGYYRGYYRPYYGYRAYYDPWGYRYRPYRGGGARETRVGRGFRYLIDGDPKRAVTVFAKLAEAQPYDVLPKLGYAIAMSELGELELGVWAMRRAIRTDPEAVRDAPLPYLLRPRVRALLAVYHPAHSDDPQLGHDEGAHFMVAALSWLLGDQAGASSATQWALAGGDNHESTLLLSRALPRPDFESGQESFSAEPRPD